jgi:hypothetical protein
VNIDCIETAQDFGFGSEPVSVIMGAKPAKVDFTQKDDYDLLYTPNYNIGVCTRLKYSPLLNEFLQMVWLDHNRVLDGRKNYFHSLNNFVCQHVIRTRIMPGEDAIAMKQRQQRTARDSQQRQQTTPPMSKDEIERDCAMAFASGELDGTLFPYLYYYCDCIFILVDLEEERRLLELEKQKKVDSLGVENTGNNPQTWNDAICFLLRDALQTLCAKTKSTVRFLILFIDSEANFPCWPIEFPPWFCSTWLIGDSTPIGARLAYPRPITITLPRNVSNEMCSDVKKWKATCSQYRSLCSEPMFNNVDMSEILICVFSLLSLSTGLPDATILPTDVVRHIVMFLFAVSQEHSFKRIVEYLGKYLFNNFPCLA